MRMTLASEVVLTADCRDRALLAAAVQGSGHNFGAVAVPVALQADEEYILAAAGRRVATWIGAE